MIATFASDNTHPYSTCNTTLPVFSSKAYTYPYYESSGTTRTTLDLKYTLELELKRLEKEIRAQPRRSDLKLQAINLSKKLKSLKKA